LPGISGQEEKVAAFIRKKASPFADEIIEKRWETFLSSIRRKYLFKYGSSLASHMDESESSLPPSETTVT
jgi:putative aminopeptidase FrvX